MKRVISGNELHILDDSDSLVLLMKETLNENGVCTVSLSGIINNSNAAEIGDELFALLSVDKEIILDMSNVSTLVTPAFAEMLVRLQIKAEKTSQETLPIQNMPRKVHDELKSYGCLMSLDYELKEENNDGL